jgi:hypothetical protein
MTSNNFFSTRECQDFNRAANGATSRGFKGCGKTRGFERARLLAVPQAL